MTEARLRRFAERLRAAWSVETASTWSPTNPAAGQCSVTAIVAQALLGGEILKTGTLGGAHFYNCIAGARVDFTAEQFGSLLSYQDLPSDREEAMADTSPEQVRSLLAALSPLR